jgi:hypothetical protein
MRLDWTVRSAAWLLAAGLLLPAAPSAAQSSTAAASAPDYKAKAAQYALARRAFDDAAAAYWKSISEKRRVRNDKRRKNQPVELDDYVLTHPPVYAGPPRPIDPSAPKPERDPTEQPKPEIPVVADFLRHAAQQFGFVPQRPPNEIAFKRAYAGVASAAGVTREQAVGIYAFETGGNGTYDVQAGLTHPRPGARAISPAVGYNQLLSTNSVGLLAEHGDRFVALLRQKSQGLTGEVKTTMERKIEAVRRMVAFSRSVPNNWNDHDILAKTTAGGMGLHAAILDIDLGPLLQTQKLLNSVLFARRNGRKTPLTGAELELMNFTGDGNGIDMVLMPPALREKVPTANFFQQAGYERNPIARRTATVAGLVASIETRMDQWSKLPGARDMAAAFEEATRPAGDAKAGTN